MTAVSFWHYIIGPGLLSSEPVRTAALVGTVVAVTSGVIGVFTNLDLSSEQGVVAVLARLAREQQIAVLISAHEMNPLLGSMDRVVYVAAGRAAAGTADEVIRSEVLSALYGSHVDVLHVHGRVLVVAGDRPGRAPGSLRAGVSAAEAGG